MERIVIIIINSQTFNIKIAEECCARLVRQETSLNNNFIVLIKAG